MRHQKTINIIVAGIICSMFFYFFAMNKKSSDNMHTIYNSNLQTKIISKNGNISGGRSYDYKLENGEVLTFFRNQKVLVNDSVAKVANSWKVNIFRKDRKNKFVYLVTYDLSLNYK